MIQTNVRYAGLDLHKRTSTITIMDDGGYPQPCVKLENAETDKFFEVLSQPNKLTMVAVESTYNWYWMADLLESFPNVRMVLANPLLLKPTRKKTDKIDSISLAKLLMMNNLPQVHITSKYSRNIKNVLRFRAYLVDQRSGIKRRLHALLSKMNFTSKYSNVLGMKSQKWLLETIKTYPYKEELESSLKIADKLNQEIKNLDLMVKDIALKHQDIELITSVPGIGYVTGLTILSEIDDINRFPNPRKLCSYAGLVPKVISSGDHTFYGKAVKGNSYIRTMLAESFYMSITKDPYLKQSYEALKIKKGSGKAKLAIMRKIMTSIFFVLSRREPYKYRQLSESKLG